MNFPAIDQLSSIGGRFTAFMLWDHRLCSRRILPPPIETGWASCSLHAVSRRILSKEETRATMGPPILRACNTSSVLQQGVQYGLELASSGRTVEFFEIRASQRGMGGILAFILFFGALALADGGSRHFSLPRGSSALKEAAGCESDARTVCSCPSGFFAREGLVLRMRGGNAPGSDVQHRGGYGGSYARGRGRRGRGPPDWRGGGRGGSRPAIPRGSGSGEPYGAREKNPLEIFLNKEVHIQAVGDTEYRGIVRGFDGFGNIVLDNSTEYIMQSDEEDEDVCHWTGETRRSACLNTPIYVHLSVFVADDLLVRLCFCK